MKARDGPTQQHGDFAYLIDRERTQVWLEIRAILSENDRTVRCVRARGAPDDLSLGKIRSRGAGQLRSFVPGE